MGKYEVTQAEYESVMSNNPSLYTGKTRHPVEKVSWRDALSYCQKLTARDQASGALPMGYVYRLPTEAEWEYACRAGTATRFSFGNDPGYLQVGEYAWFSENSDSQTHPVGTKTPNPWGLYDMHGNVLEWCLDTWNGALPGGQATDPRSPSTGFLRAARGGSWLYEGRFCRSANRDEYGVSNRCSDLGFRVILAPMETEPAANDATSEPFPAGRRDSSDSQTAPTGGATQTKLGP
jgi:formylglycine-generating enzyme required for sulfatase activity